MGVTTIDEHKYAKLLGKALPKVIETHEEFDRMVETLEALHIPPRDLTSEEAALADLLTSLIQQYDDLHHPLPQAEPHQMVQYLLEARRLRQTDLVAVMGSRSQVSDLVNGKRAISKAQVRKLADFFNVSTDLFF